MFPGANDELACTIIIVSFSTVRAASVLIHATATLISLIHCVLIAVGPKAGKNKKKQAEEAPTSSW
jgi:hypothetical protein